MLIGVARRVRELGAHLLSTRSTATSIGTVAHALRGRRAFRVTRRHMVAMALLLQAVMAASSDGLWKALGISVVSSRGLERLWAALWGS